MKRRLFAIGCALACGAGGCVRAAPPRASAPAASFAVQQAAKLIELDVNGDGKPDLLRRFDESAALAEERRDLDFDGRFEEATFFANGQRIRAERDRDGDGRTDTWVFYEEGRITEKREDLDGDGKPDAWELFERGQLARIGRDTDGDGKPDAWEENPLR